MLMRVAADAGQTEAQVVFFLIMLSPFDKWTEKFLPFATYELRDLTWWPWRMCWRWRRQWRPQSWSFAPPCFGKRLQVYWDKKKRDLKDKNSLQEYTLCGVTWRFGGGNLPTTEFELFDNVTDLLKPVSVTLLFALIVGDHLHSQSTKNKQTFMNRSCFFPPSTLLC